MLHNEETTPLVNRRRGGALQDDDDSAPIVIDDDLKEDRRNCSGRIKAACITFFAFRGGKPSNEELYYRDSYNDFSWKCTFGTREEDGIWMNQQDRTGTIMSFLVWILIIYCGVTMMLLAESNHLPYLLAMFSTTICALALASHAKTMFTDPGGVPHSAVPISNQPGFTHPMCSHCKTYKPPFSHHCRICNRCISRMDHHCPWMNNCVGAGNMKFFILFLCYTWIGSAFALLIFAWNYFLCISEKCMFSPVLVQLVRAMTVICIGALLFTSSMLMSVLYGVLTGIGTIDRLKKESLNMTSLSDEEPIALEDIFGIAGYYTWPLPIDPLYEDYDRVMGYSTTQRLLRERENNKRSGSSAMSSVAGAVSSTASDYNNRYSPV